MANVMIMLGFGIEAYMAHVFASQNPLFLK